MPGRIARKLTPYFVSEILERELDGLIATPAREDQAEQLAELDAGWLSPAVQTTSGGDVQKFLAHPLR